MFGRVYFGEVKKAFRLKTVIIMAIIAIVAAAIMAAVFVSMNKLVDEWGDEASIGELDTLIDGSSGARVYKEEDVAAELNELYAMRDELKKERKKDDYDYYRGNDYLYAINSEIAVLEYVRDNKLYDKPMAVYESTGGLGVLSGKMTADAFIVYLNSTLFTLVMIYGAIVAGSIFADEFKQGTIKLLLMRPISRNEMTTAKLLASLTHVFGAYLFTFLLAVIVGFISFPVEHVATLFTFNAGSVSVADNTAQIGISFALGLIPVLAYTVLSFAIGAMTRNKVLAIVTPVLIIDIVYLIFRLAGLGRFFFTDAVNWMQFVGTSSTLLGGANFFISLAVTIVYMGGLLAGSYLVIDKKDIV